jgi:hypothetical protein
MFSRLINESKLFRIDPERAERIAKEHIHALRDMFMEIEQEELRLSTAVMRLEGWKRGDGEG